MKPAPKDLGPFFHPGSGVGILLVHGFTSTPLAMEPLAVALSKAGYTTSVPMLAGHGTTPEQMAKTTAEEWYASADKAYQQLAKVCEKVFVIGGSLGAVIACRLAARHPLEGVVLLGAPMLLERQWLIRLGTVLFPLVGKHFYEKGRTRFGIRYYENAPKVLEDKEEVMGSNGQSYRHIPIPSIRQLLRFVKNVKSKDIPRLTDMPVLVVQSMSDGLVDPRSGEILFSSLPAKDKKLVWVEEPHHRIHSGGKDDRLYQLVIEFIEGHSGA